MRFVKGGLPFLIHGLKVQEAPYDTGVADNQLAISTDPLAPTIIAPTPPYGTSYWAEFRNASSGGQQIRYGQAPKFTATVGGIVLMPGDSATVYQWGLSIIAVANAAGAVLDRFIRRTT